MVSYRHYEESDLLELESMIISLYAEDPTGIPINKEKIHATVSHAKKHPDTIKIIMILKNEHLA